MPATIDHVETHIAQSIECGGLPRYEKIFNLSKSSKEDPPLNGFINYYAYKGEERKFNLRYPEKQKKKGSQKEPKLRLKDTNVLHPSRVFDEYVCEKNYQKKEYFISENQYLQLEFMNQVPEIICDLLYYLSGYVHYRTDLISKDVYQKMLIAQINNTSVAT